jgi:hypothetical protein
MQGSGLQASTLNFVQASSIVYNTVFRSYLLFFEGAGNRCRSRPMDAKWHLGRF